MKVLVAEPPAAQLPPVGRLERLGDRDWLVVTVNGRVPSDLRVRAEQLPVIALLTDPTPHVLKQVLADGAQVVVDARGGVGRHRLADAADMASEYGVHVDPRLQHMAWRTRNTNGPLTERQQEVLELYASGLQQGEIAQRLGIGLHTVGDHYSAIRERLEAESMAEAVEIAHEKELL